MFIAKAQFQRGTNYPTRTCYGLRPLARRRPRGRLKIGEKGEVLKKNNSWIVRAPCLPSPPLVHFARRAGDRRQRIVWRSAHSPLFFFFSFFSLSTTHVSTKGKKNAGTSIKVARELRSVPAACELAGAAYGAVYSARRGYSGELWAFSLPLPIPLWRKVNVRKKRLAYQSNKELTSGLFESLF
jgi:hypothetical protein